MKATFLGTGTSSGVPTIGCDCDVCRSTDPRNNRRRASLYVEAAGQALLIDTPPDFREQALAYEVLRVDAVLFTHAHADHVFGFDDIRRYNVLADSVIPAYADESTMADLKRIFDYISAERVPGLFTPRIDFREFDAPFRVGEVCVAPVAVEHGRMPTSGFRIDAEGRSLGYVPDCASMPEDSVKLLQGVDVMILDALKYTPHMTHLTVADSVALLQRIGAPRSYLIHMGHHLDHAATEAELPGGIMLSYDGLILEV